VDWLKKLVIRRVCVLSVARAVPTSVRDPSRPQEFEPLSLTSVGTFLRGFAKGGEESGFAEESRFVQIMTCLKVCWHGFGSPTRYRYVGTAYLDGRLGLRCGRRRRRGGVRAVRVGNVAAHAEGLLKRLGRKMSNGPMPGISWRRETLMREVYGNREGDFLRICLCAPQE